MLIFLMYLYAGANVYLAYRKEIHRENELGPRIILFLICLFFWPLQPLMYLFSN